MMNKKIVLAVCGSVAAIETPKIARELRRKGYDIECVMSEAAQKIIHPNVMEWASGNKVITEITGRVEHVSLCGIDGEAALLLVCPCTSNTISKTACGIEDTPVTTMAATALGSGTPIVMVPAMHLAMYQNPFVKENIKKLLDKGIHMIEPECEESKAKIADKEKIIKKSVDVMR
ncbi:MAG: flavoprotein [Candidatus Altiarchaeota archaeon]|nr:flavoprotein [Candidatus Altiarchaeota archaeon]